MSFRSPALGQGSSSQVSTEGFKAVSLGEELYEQAAAKISKNLIEDAEYRKKIFQQLKSCEASSDVESNSVENIMTDDVGSERSTCGDFTRPRFNSSRLTSHAIESRIKAMKDLPKEVEALVKSDTRFSKFTTEQASRVLNIPMSKKIYKDLPPIEPEHSAVCRVRSQIKKDLNAVRSSFMPKDPDPEPNIRDYNDFCNTRIKPNQISDVIYRPGVSHLRRPDGSTNFVVALNEELEKKAWLHQ